MTSPLTRESAARLQVVLAPFASAEAWRPRIAFDPVLFPHRYSDPRDIEVVGFIAGSLAYGRAALFKPQIALIVDRLGAHPARELASLSVGRAKQVVDGFLYRFNVPADMAVLLLGLGATIERAGSLERVFVSIFRQHHDWRLAIAQFASMIRTSAPETEVERHIGKTRGLAHLLPMGQGGVAKRMTLFLRWMVRGPDAIDFGIWKEMGASELCVPLDTHVARISRQLGLTRRGDLSWRTVEEVTGSLRMIDADDPIRYDFALCHFGMSANCPVTPVVTHCRACTLQTHCTVGQKALNETNREKRR